MKVVDTFPRPVRDIEHCWIPLKDGCRLAARIWLPEDADASPVPAILEYIPYRKRDFSRVRDERMHHYFAGHGYAAVRVDLRGSGESDGLLLDEYLEQEQNDALDVIRWIAGRPWCTGAVGMMGKSWGGFNALQVAARRPADLKAVISVCATDDRYADDAHFMGGCLLNENLIWGSVFMNFNAQPPDPALIGERWRNVWLARLEHILLFPEVWLRHQRRDSYWKHGSVCEDYSRIRCPVYAIGGWADGYSNAVPRLLSGLTGPRKGLIGPWAHVYAHDGVPGPAIGFLQEALRWWDHWLKGSDNTLMEEPAYRVWMQDRIEPNPIHDDRPGRWVAEPYWPSERIVSSRYVINGSGLSLLPEPELRIEIRSPQTVGLCGGDWCGFGVEGEMPLDQREDDGKSLCFDSPPLDAGLEILGAPEVTIALTANRTRAIVAVRLNDVAPDGASARVTFGILNLTHRDSHSEPEPLEPGRRYQVRVRLNDIAHAFNAGHRIRVAISTSYWPMVWPAPESVTLGIFTGASDLVLPVRPPSAEDHRLPEFLRPEAAPAPAMSELTPAQYQRTIERDVATGESVYTTYMDGGDFGDAGSFRVDGIDLEIGQTLRKRFGIADEDPCSAWAEVVQSTRLGRSTWSTRIALRTRLSATPAVFRVQAELQAYEGEHQIFSRTWDRLVPRDLM